MSKHNYTRGSVQSKRKAVYEKTNGRCVYCTDQISMDTFHVDHLYPFSKGGNSNIENLLPSCSVCNLEKSNKLVVPEVITRVVENTTETEALIRRNKDLNFMVDTWKKIAKSSQKTFETQKWIEEWMGAHA